MKRLLCTMLIVLATVAGGATYLITQSQQVSAEGSAALSIVPKKTYTIESGKSVEDTLVVRNIDRTQPLHLSIRVIDFTYHDESGAPKLMLDENSPRTTWSLRPFLNVPKTVTVEPGATRTLDMSVSMPKEVGAGSFYSAIVYSSGSSDGGNVGQIASGVTLVFTSVPGKVKENLTLESLGTYNSAAKKYTYFNTDEPQRIAYTLKNEGNVFESPVGSITIRNLFGQEKTINNINPNGSLALIGQTRTFETCIKMKEQEVDFAGTRTEATTCANAGLWPGYYNVEINGFYGQNGNNTKDIVGTGAFWYLPWWFIAIALVVLAYVGFHTYRLVRFIRRRKNGGSAKMKSRSFRRKR